MWGQSLNRQSRPRGLRLVSARPIRDTQTGFIHHPPGFPLEFKRVWFSSLHRSDELHRGELGLIFDSEKYVKPGWTLEITIPMRNEIARFQGKVVLIRHSGEGYEIGLWLRRGADASRARIVEQICHIEAYTQERKYRDGPYCLNRERIAQEWIMENAGSVPTL
jgi:hypothetical protein